MLAEAAGPDQRAARKMRPGHCTKKIPLGSPAVTVLGTDTSVAQSHPTLLKKYLMEGNVCKQTDVCKPEEGWYGQPNYCYKKQYTLF